MKIARIGPSGGEKPAVIDEQGIVRDASGLIGEWSGATLVEELRKLETVDLSRLPVISPPFRYGPPVSGIGKIIGIGLNYRSHAEEAGMALPAEPTFFLKATSSIIGPNDDVMLPRGSVKGDWEIELGVVIGKAARYVREADAMDHVAGYCIVNDVSERELQLERGTQWTKGKSCDTFGPIGPWLVTRDEIADPHNLRLILTLNDEVMQDGHTDDLVITVPQLIARMSEIFTLHPGDIISTGRPGGVGLGMRPSRFLKAGDEMHLQIGGLGEQRQKVMAHQ
nr:fumarylacetoacetate hydrolase family protein [Sphingomonas sp. CDS-1]